MLSAVKFDGVASILVRNEVAVVRQLGWEHKLGVKMTSFRRLVMGLAEAMAVLSIFFGTFYGGILGAASGAFFRSGIFGNDISLQGIGHIATTGVVFGFIMGAILGFVLSSSLAATVFFFAQIERNTRRLLERERFEGPTQYRADLRF